MTAPVILWFRRDLRLSDQAALCAACADGPRSSGQPPRPLHDPESAGCRPPDYPASIIGHREGRERAPTAWRSIKA